MGQHGADGSAGVGRRLIGRLRAMARRIRGVVALQAQDQEHDRETEGDERSGSQRTLAYGHGTPSRRGAAWTPAD